VTAFRSVVLDVDSTVSSLEGIDWLAEQRDAEVAARVSALTDDAMNARVPIDEVYGRRLHIIRPTIAELNALAHAYISTVLPGVHDALAQWRASGVKVVLVSGGLRHALLPLGAALGIAADDVFGVDLSFDADGIATGIMAEAPLARRGGKPQVVAALALARPILAVGDGATDAELAPIVDRFVAFTGVARRAPVVALADGEARSFAELTSIVLGH
jgi:phosphoserine phosphatase